jgi:hypothetical protein
MIAGSSARPPALNINREPVILKTRPPIIEPVLGVREHPDKKRAGLIPAEDRFMVVDTGSPATPLVSAFVRFSYKVYELDQSFCFNGEP